MKKNAKVYLKDFVKDKSDWLKMGNYYLNLANSTNSIGDAL